MGNLIAGILGVLAFVMCVGHAEKSRTWPVQVLWVVIALTAALAAFIRLGRVF